MNTVKTLEILKKNIMEMGNDEFGNDQAMKGWNHCRQTVLDGIDDAILGATDCAMDEFETGEWYRIGRNLFVTELKTGYLLSVYHPHKVESPELTFIPDYHNENFETFLAMKKNWEEKEKSQLRP